MIPKIFTTEDEARLKLLEGAKIVFDAVKSTYSPKSGNVGIELKWGSPVASHDGVTVARSLGHRDGRINTGIEIVKEASEQTNRTAGDGTSATVILTYKMFERAAKLVAAGYNAMELARGMERAAGDIIASINTVKKDVTEADLRHIATVSSGSEAIGALIANTIIKVGEGSGITIEESHTPNITAKIIKGFHFGKGVDNQYQFNDYDMRRAAYDNCWILAIEKSLKDVSDVKPILTWLNKQENKNMLIVGNVSGPALEVLIANKLNGFANIVSVAPISIGEMTSEFLADVAAITGGQVIPKAFNLDDIGPDQLGFAARIVSTESTTTIFDGAVDSEGKKAIAERVENLKKQIKSSKDAALVERLEGRVAKLTGKIGVIRVGAPTETNRREKLLRVEDAVMAVRAAREDGYVPGGATTLLRIGANAVLHKVEATDEHVGYSLVFQAIQDPFKILLNNTGIEDIGYHKYAVLKAKDGFGYNVRDLTEEPINLYEAGIIDPAKVVKQAVQNAVSNAAVLVTMNGLVTLDIDEIRKDRVIED